jgi:hypothetical protein
MTCSIHNLPDGTRAIVCGSHSYVKKNERCRWCSAPGTQLCDWPTGETSTCDARMCKGHAKHIEHDKDYCPDHAKEIS